MGAPRHDLINYEITKTYHIICTCVQQDALRASRARKQMVRSKLIQLQSVFFIAVLKFSIMGNHLHLILRASPDIEKGLTDEQVMRLWAIIHPSRDRIHRPLEVTHEWIRRQIGNQKLVAKTRQKLGCIS